MMRWVMRLDYGSCIVQDAAIIELENQVHSTNFKIKENQTPNKQPGWKCIMSKLLGRKKCNCYKKKEERKN